MDLVFFAHPEFLGSQSMPRFVGMLANGMKNKGYKVQVWQPKAIFYNIPFLQKFKKWLGYIDQYIIFPIVVKSRLRGCTPGTLFVFADQALGPWVPLVKNFQNVVHCHDFLAQRSALGQIPENPTSLSGRLYQKFIYNGYSKANHFISVSYKTRDDLHTLLKRIPDISEVVYNGMNKIMVSHSTTEARAIFASKTKLNIEDGYILHVGGNQWYKNRVGMIEIYNAWRSISLLAYPLVLIGSSPSALLTKTYHASPYKNDIHFLTSVDDSTLDLAYAGASVFVFPSLAEGFGWPIAEAMAAGTPVITTDEAPMTEVAGGAAKLIQKRPVVEIEPGQWASHAATVVNEVLNFNENECALLVNSGFKNAARFDTEKALEAIELIYKCVLAL